MTGDLVDVIIAVRNEEVHVGNLINRLMESEASEINRCVVAVGPSSDATLEIVRGFAAKWNQMIVVENPEGFVSTGLNRCLDLCSSPLLLRLDGHLNIPPGLVKHLKSSLHAQQADCLGPRVRAIGRSCMQRAIANAMNSPLGVGSATFRTGLKTGRVDTVAFGLYRRQLVDKVGKFNPDLLRNQDDEFNARFIESGGSIYLDPTIEVEYFPRETILALGSQYFDYGVFRAYARIHHQGKFGFRQWIPVLHTAALVGATSAIVLGKFRLPAMAYVVLYAIGLSLLLAKSWRRLEPPRLLSLGPSATMHFTYGLGVIAGFIWSSWHRSGKRPNVSRNFVKFRQRARQR